LVIAAEGALSYLPFAALVSSAESRKYLVDNYIISVIPSLSAVDFNRPERGKWKPTTPRLLTAFADPDLSGFKLRVQSAADAPNAEPDEKLQPLTLGANEANAVATLFKGKEKVYLRTEANDQRASADAATSTFLLFSTPIRLGDDAPSAVGIALSKGGQSDGFLGTEEIFNLKLNAELVLLSGAYTVPDKLSSGEGVNLLTGGLLYAGTESVALSLWRVNDPSRVQFTESLFAALKSQIAGGYLDKADALHRAQLKLRQNKATSHPFHWAAFVLAGDWF